MISYSSCLRFSISLRPKYWDGLWKMIHFMFVLLIWLNQLMTHFHCSGRSHQISIETFQDAKQSKKFLKVYGQETVMSCCDVFGCKPPTKYLINTGLFQVLPMDRWLQVWSAPANPSMISGVRQWTWPVAWTAQVWADTSRFLRPPARSWQNGDSFWNFEERYLLRG